jgi:hypothetical protein
MAPAKGMDPARWQEIERLYHAAHERPVPERAAFLAQACLGDPALRHEVELLLAQAASADGFLEAGALAAVGRTRGPSVLTGRRLGVYEVQEQIGAGGMGEVYRARDTRLRRDVAIKILPVGVSPDHDHNKRLQREAQAIASLNHPHICVIHDVGQHDGINFLVMEYLEGRTLRQHLLDRAPLPLNETLQIAGEITRALVEAHRHGLVHRDVKPSNIMLTVRGAKLLDFGLARTFQYIDPQSTDTLTLGGAVLGTPPYMSPEQVLTGQVDARSDIFSLGVVMYEMTTGRRPFDGAHVPEIVDAVLHKHPEGISALNPDAPPELEKLVTKCLEKDRERRYQSADDVWTDLRNIGRGTGPRIQSDLCAAPSSAETEKGPLLVGREEVLERMFDMCAPVLRGTRQVLFVTGEPGAGKTALVREFIVRAEKRLGISSTWGQCIEHYGIGEAYQPLLEALMRLGQRPSGNDVVATLTRYGPTWLGLLPGLLDSSYIPSLPRPAPGTTRERMLRELTVTIEALSEKRPLILWLDDLHWCDSSSLDWITAFAMRPERARLMLIGTFRPDALQQRQPLAALFDMLGAKSLSRQIALGGLDSQAVKDIVSLRHLSETRVRRHVRTSGHSRASSH